MKLSGLKLRIRAIFKPDTVERELDDELGFHIECETRKLMAAGVNAAEALQHARARFGSIPLAADQCRDERGVDFFETLARDVRFALRTFRRTPLVALTVVSTIALGLGVVTVAFTFFNMFFFRVDAVRNPDELFAVERPTRPGFRGHVPFTWTEYEAIRQGTNVFTDVAAARPSIPTRINGRAARGMFVSGNFFDMLGVTATRGRTLTQADNEDGGRAVVVLTQLGWEKFKKEIGVRMALGATPRDIVRLVVSQSMRPIAIGVLVGGGLAAVTAIVLLSMPAAGMIGTAIHAFDPLAYAVGLGIIVATCLLAAFVPARRAAHINPIATLRAD